MSNTHFQRSGGTESGRKWELERGDKLEYQRETEIGGREGEQERGKTGLKKGDTNRRKGRDKKGKKKMKEEGKEGRLICSRRGRRKLQGRCAERRKPLQIES